MRSRYVSMPMRAYNLTRASCFDARRTRRFSPPPLFSMPFRHFTLMIIFAFHGSLPIVAFH